MKGFDRYLKEVTEGKIIIGESERLMVERHFKDLEKSLDPTYPYKFERSLANKAITVSRNFRYWEGILAGEHFDPHPFQEFIIGSLFGWIKKENEYNKPIRRFRKGYLQVAKKNAKTFLDAVISLICWLIDNEQGGQYYYAATTREQAGICFTCTKEIVLKLRQDSPPFSETTKTQAHTIYNVSMAATMRAISSEAGNIEGKGAHCAIIDEYHLHRTTEVLDNMESGMVGRPQPLMMVTTTAGFNLQYPCFKFYKQCKRILEEKANNERLFVAIFEPDKGDSHHNKELWSKSNPLARNYAVLQEGINEQYNKSILGGGTEEVDFRTKHFNQWVGSYTTWIPNDTWNASRKDYTLDDLKEFECIGSLDLSSVRDLTCYYLTFRTPDHKYYSWPYFFVPSAKVSIHGTEDGVNYYDWVQDKHLIRTPGNSIDYEFVEKVIDESIEKFNIKAIEYDPYNAHQFIPKLEAKGYPVQKFGQGITNMSSPTKLSEKIIIDGDYYHNSNPVMDWMIENVELYIDANANCKIVKTANKEAKKVDGPICLVMGIGGFDMLPEVKESNYKKRGFASL